MVKPYFSIIIPTLNEERHLPDLLKDLSVQTFQDFEVIVVDASSTDKTVEKAKTFLKKFQKLLILGSEKGNVSYQRNLGGKRAGANWLVFMDADNRIPKYFLLGLKFHTEVLNPDILSTWMEPEGKSSQDKATAVIMNVFIDINKNTTNPYVLESLLLIKRVSFKKLKGFNTTIPWHEGGDLLRRAKREKMKFEFMKTPRYTYSFRRFRKEGAYKLLRNDAQMELLRIINKKLPKNEAELLYPMEGGNFYRVGRKENSRIKKLILSFLRSFTSSW